MPTLGGAAAFESGQLLSAECVSCQSGAVTHLVGCPPQLVPCVSVQTLTQHKTCSWLEASCGLQLGKELDVWPQELCSNVHGCDT